MKDNWRRSSIGTNMLVNPNLTLGPSNLHPLLVAHECCALPDMRLDFPSSRRRCALDFSQCTGLCASPRVLPERKPETVERGARDSRGGCGPDEARGSGYAVPPESACFAGDPSRAARAASSESCVAVAALRS